MEDLQSLVIKKKRDIKLYPVCPYYMQFKGYYEGLNGCLQHCKEPVYGAIRAWCNCTEGLFTSLKEISKLFSGLI